MYVCLCQAVTDRDIKREVTDGACCMRDLQQRLGIASTCGRCAPCAREVLGRALQERQRATALQPFVVAPASANAS